MEIEHALLAVGLTKNEVKSYLALLRIGRSTSYRIVKEAGVSSGKIYETLDRLNERGLVSALTIHGKKHFEAADPERILDFLQGLESDLREKRDRIKDIVPLLRKERKGANAAEASLYQGIEGIKTAYELLLRASAAKETICVLGASTRVGERLGGYLDSFNERRIEKKVRLKILFTERGAPREEALRNLPLTQARLLESQPVAPAWTIVSKSHLATFTLGERPTGFVLEDADAAKTHLNYFSLLWKMAGE